MSIDRFEIVDHTADWAIRVVGRDLVQLLVHAAQGMNSLLVAELAAVGDDETRQLELEAFDAESLLVDWLSELAYWAEEAQLIFQRFELSDVTATHLQATLHGGRAAQLEKHIKAVTYHNLAITETGDGLEVTIVFDV
jgi:SHS2 domain-containing protein